MKSRIKNLLCCIFLTLVVLGFGGCQKKQSEVSMKESKVPKGDTLAQEAYTEMITHWDSLLSLCGESYYSAVNWGYLKDGRAIGHYSIFEFKGVSINLEYYAEKFSAADELNGITWKGSFGMNSEVFRYRVNNNTEWSSWKDGTPNLIGADAEYIRGSDKSFSCSIEKHGEQWKIKNWFFSLPDNRLQKVDCSQIESFS